MSKNLFPGMENMLSFSKEERAYLRNLLQAELISLARELMSCNRDEDIVQAILNKLEEQ